MRIRTLVVVGLLPLLVLMVLAAPAAAGGWWNYVDVDKRHVAAGDRITSRNEVMFPTIALAQQARSERFYAYLVRGIDRDLLNAGMSQGDPKRWWSRPAESFRMGRIEWVTTDSNIAVVAVEMTVPDVAPGRYGVMLCDAGCRNPFGSTVPTEGLRVHATAAAAANAERAADLRTFMQDARAMDQALAADTDALRESSRRSAALARSDAQEAMSAAARAERDVRRLEGLLTTLAADEQSSPWPEQAGWIAAALVAAAWAGSAVYRRRVAPGPPAPPDPAEATTDHDWEYAGRR